MGNAGDPFHSLLLFFTHFSPGYVNLFSFLLLCKHTLSIPSTAFPYPRLAIGIRIVENQIAMEALFSLCILIIPLLCTFLENPNQCNSLTSVIKSRTTPRLRTKPTIMTPRPSSSIIPPLLQPYLLQSKRSNSNTLTLLTSTLSTSTNWLLLLLLHHHLSTSSSDFGVGIIFVSFLRDHEFWRNGLYRLVRSSFFPFASLFSFSNPESGSCHSKLMISHLCLACLG